MYRITIFIVVLPSFSGCSLGTARGLATHLCDRRRHCGLKVRIRKNVRMDRHRARWEGPHQPAFCGHGSFVGRGELEHADVKAGVTFVDPADQHAGILFSNMQSDRASCNCYDLRSIWTKRKLTLVNDIMERSLETVAGNVAVIMAVVYGKHSGNGRPDMLYLDSMLVIIEAPEIFQRVRDDREKGRIMLPARLISLR